MQSAISRVVGVGAVQEHLHRDSQNRVDLAQLLPDLARGVIDTRYSKPIALSLQTRPVHVSLQIASNLGLILNELLDNAIKHSNGNGIELHIEPLDSATARICICDQGPGFSDDVLDAFAASGTPLALSLVDALSKRCGATVQRSNKPLTTGHGAQVELILKLDPAH